MRSSLRSAMYWAYSRNSPAVSPRSPSGRHLLGVGDFESTAVTLITLTLSLETRPSTGSGFSALMPLMRSTAEVEMDGFVPHNVLKLLADARHPVSAVEGENHGKAGVKEDSLHDDVVADEVFEELLAPPPASRCVKSGSSTPRSAPSQTRPFQGSTGTSRYILKTSCSSRPRLSTM